MGRRGCHRYEEEGGRKISVKSNLKNPRTNCQFEKHIYFVLYSNEFVKYNMHLDILFIYYIQM